MRIGSRAALAVLTAALAVLVTFVGAGGAAAAPVRPAENIPGPFRISNWDTPNLCMDTDGFNVYHGTCASKDSGQKWGWHTNGYLKHLASGKCLTLFAPSTEVFVVDCPNSKAGHWTHQHWAILNLGFDQQCLRSGSVGTAVRAVACTNQHQAWSVTYW